MRSCKLCLPVLAICLTCGHHGAGADDYFLTIGGGYSPSGNQASLEKNVLYFQRVLARRRLHENPATVLFADGDSPANDLQVIDPHSVPEANRLMAEFFGSDRNLGLHYRNHQISDVAGETSPDTIRGWFRDVGSTMKAGDRLVLYVAAHGSSSRDRQRPYNTSILLWNRQRLAVDELVDLLDGLPQGVQFVTVMVQCHAGGFARCIFNQADPDAGLSSRLRCGFFATVHDRAAAGCTPEVDEAGYVEYSTYFWEALSGTDRLGRSIDAPDYDGDGTVSFDEAHAYTVLHSETIDLPIKTSGEFLRRHSRIADESESHLLAEDVHWKELLQFASDAEKAILEGLSDELNLRSGDPLGEARRQLETQSRGRRSGSRGRSRGRSLPRLDEKLREEIADDLRQRWPELANVLNPLAIELLTERSEAFVDAVKQHPKYERYRRETRRRDNESDPRKQRVRYERLLRTAENVLLAENLRRGDDADLIERFEAILAAEHGTLGRPTELPHVAALTE